MSKEHLIPFKKGQSGNPNGRPRELPNLNKILNEVLGEEKDNVTAAQIILMALRNKATKGDVRAAEILLDRAYGKSKQILDIKTEVTIEKTTIKLPDGTEYEI